MANLDQFEKIIRQKLLTDKEVNHDILDIQRYTLNNSGVPFVYIKTLYTPILEYLQKYLKIAAPTVERNYILFHKDNIGYQLMFRFLKLNMQIIFITL